MVRHDGWLDAADAGYLLRLGPDRRARVVLRLDESTFRALANDPGLRGRRGGGWIIRRDVPTSTGPAAGKPGFVDGERVVVEADGLLVTLRANLGESPLAWLARRKDPAGRPWLTPVEVAAGVRLRDDAELAGRGASLTMRWDALPRSAGARGARTEPSDRALAAGQRVESALVACGPRLRVIVDRICIRESSLQLAESDLGLRRRQGKTLLKLGLQALVEHYDLG